jgi:hypothetical protein
MMASRANVELLTKPFTAENLARKVRQTIDLTRALALRVNAS